MIKTLFLFGGLKWEEYKSFWNGFSWRNKNALESVQFQQHHYVKSIIEIMSFSPNILKPALKKTAKHSHSPNLINYNYHSGF